ncbi:MAG: prepilin-type N-terminal cleavage/methylation domain-containing protein, partial [Deltaproteobacteria bacterium]|nr:prepilin-type N-terminal cleavage/methylation domain-containing protein [Deltaproteobacteria bacterium]
MTTKRRKQAGFTLIELMVSMTLFSFAIAGVLAIAVSMAQGYREQRQVVQTESTARGALEFIADAVRMTSPAVQNADLTATTATPAAGEPHIVVGDIEDTESQNDITTGKCKTGAIRIYDSATGPDTLEIVHASGGAVTSVGSGGFTAGTASLPLTDITAVAVGDHLLVTNGTRGHVVRVTTLTAGIAPAGTATVATGACIVVTATAYAQGELVIRVLKARFYVGTFDSITPVLIMDPDGDGIAAAPEPLADYVEDFQVAVGVDELADNSIDPTTEWGFSMGGPTSFTLGRDVRALRITLVARAATSLPGTAATYRRPEVENNPQA